MITGPSGAGKTTLARDVILASVEESKAIGCDGVEGPTLRPVMVDQSPIGNNPRTNPATYTKVLDRIRAMFAKATGVTASAFSFNRPEGACEGCEGYGAIEVKLPRLAPAWVECEACEGARFRPEVLEHAIERGGRELTIADVLDLPVSEALALLSDDKVAAKILHAMDGIGLGYLSLGQPSPSLSGGEAQRIRLARHLARVKEGDLLVLDEPTIGLHPHDVDRLLDTLDRLTSGGATVLVVEHQEDVIAAADHIVDIGPGAGPDGGKLMREGPARAGATSRRSRRARSREEHREHRIACASAVPRRTTCATSTSTSRRGRSVVVTGLSGSGKSSLVGDVLEAEASRRLLECLSMYERQGTREGPEANVRAIEGLGPTVVLDGRRWISRVTVGGATGVSGHIATLLSRLGVGVCESCGARAVRRSSPLPEAHRVCDECDAEAKPAEPRHFSPDVYAAVCPGCGGVGIKQIPSEAKLIKDPTKSVRDGAFVSPGYFPRSYLIQDGTGGNKAFRAIAAAYGFDIEDAWQDIPEAGRNALLWGAKDGRGHWWGILPILATEAGDLYTDRVVCDRCHGARLRPPYDAVELAGHTRRGFHRLPLRDLRVLLASIEAPDILRDAHVAAQRRLEFLSLVGLDYINLDRFFHTLSAGEAQRVRLAAVIGSDLRDLTVLMDEPTRGLHAREVDALTSALSALAQQGNTVVVVEHDPGVIARADHVIEIGPGSGADGGRVVTSGAPSALKKGVTRDLLKGKITLPTGRERRVPKDWLVVRSPRGNNLRADEVRLPLGVIGGVCGPSGSGKSTLVVDTVGRALNPTPQTATWSSGMTRPEPHEAIEFDHPLRLVVMDQSRRGVQSPGSHLGVTNALRKRYTEHDPDAAELCDACGGRGAVLVDMVFLSNITYPCDACDGTGYTALAQAISVRGLSLPELESRSVEEVRELWSDVDPVARPLAAAVRLNLGYLKLRQPSASLSGGECQRLRLADAIARKRQSTPRLFVLDEPTLGLHNRDVAALVHALEEIVEAGDGVLLVEHHTGLLACCDWLVELDEGDVVAEGPPDELARGKTPTAPYLAEALAMNEAILLADRSPSLRRRVLVELLDVAEDDKEVRELDALRDVEAAAVPVGGAGATTRELGFALSRLAHLGLSRGHPIVDRVAKKLLRMQLDNGSWAPPDGGRGKPGDEGYSMSPLQTALPLRGLAEAGYATHAACERGYEWLLEQRLDDGSWPTGMTAGTRKFVAGYRRLARSSGCRSNTTGALACLVRHPERRESDAARRAADILLRRETREESTFGAEVSRLAVVEDADGLLDVLRALRRRVPARSLLARRRLARGPSHGRARAGDRRMAQRRGPVRPPRVSAPVPLADARRPHVTAPARTTGRGSARTTSARRMASRRCSAPDADVSGCVRACPERSRGRRAARRRRAHRRAGAGDGRSQRGPRLDASAHLRAGRRSRPARGDAGVRRLR